MNYCVHNSRVGAVQLVSLLYILLQRRHHSINHGVFSSVISLFDGVENMCTVRCLLAQDTGSVCFVSNISEFHEIVHKYFILSQSYFFIRFSKLLHQTILARKTCLFWNCAHFNDYIHWFLYSENMLNYMVLVFIVINEVWEDNLITIRQRILVYLANLLF